MRESGMCASLLLNMWRIVRPFAQLLSSSSHLTHVSLDYRPNVHIFAFHVRGHKWKLNRLVAGCVIENSIHEEMQISIRMHAFVGGMKQVNSIGFHIRSH